MNEELYKLAESIEALAEAVAKEASEESRPRSVEKRASFDYGTLGEEYNPSGADPITRFALGGE